MKLLDLKLSFEPLEHDALYEEIAQEYKFLGNHRPKMRLLTVTEKEDHNLPENFCEELADMLPALSYQLCTNHDKKSFAKHLKEEEHDLPHVLEHIIIGIFMMVKNDYYQGITLGTAEKAEIIVTYLNQIVAKKSAYLALDVLNSLIRGQKIDLIEAVKEITGGRVLIWRKPTSLVDSH